MRGDARCHMSPLAVLASADESRRAAPLDASVSGMCPRNHASASRSTGEQLIKIRRRNFINEK